MRGKRITTEIKTKPLKPFCLLFVLCLFLPLSAQGDDYALIIGGIAADKSHHDSFWGYCSKLYRALIASGYKPSNVILLFETLVDPKMVRAKSSYVEIQNACAELKVRVKKDDQLFIFVVGHAASKYGLSQINLPGKDISQRDFASLINQVGCDNVVAVLAFPTSGAYIADLSRPGRVVVSATSASEGYEPIFPEKFVESFYDPNSDLDDDGMLSSFEAFLYAKKEVEKWYKDRGMLQSEHAQIEGDGDGRGLHAVSKDSSDKDLVLAKKLSLGKVEPGLSNLSQNPSLKDLMRDSPNAESYPNSEAVILLQEETIDINEDISNEYTLHRRIKIFNEKGKRFASVTIPYTKDPDKVKVHYAKTILPDGKMANYDPKGVVKGITPPEAVESGLFLDAKLMKLQLPSVKDGCIIDYSYSITNPGHVMKGQYWKQLRIQSSVPMLKYKLNVRVPKDRNFIYHANGLALSPKVRVLDKYTKLCEFETADIPPILEEKFMPPVDDVAYSISISSLDSWDQLGKWYYTLIREQDHLTEDIRKKVEELTSGATKDSDRMRRLYDYVATNIRYVGIELGIWAIKPHAAPLVFQSGYGDCKDKATLLSAMLASVGIKSYPVLIPAGDSGGLTKEVPSLAYFNHLILAAETKDGLFWMDPTAETCAFGELPFSDQNRNCLMITEDRPRFLKTPSSSKESNLRRTQTKIEIKEKDSLSANVEVEVYVKGEFNTKLRADLKYRDPKEREKFLKGLLSIPSQDKIDEIQIDDLEILDKDLRVKVKYSGEGHFMLTGSSCLLKLPLPQNPYSDLLAHDSRENRVMVGGGVAFEDEVQVSFPGRFSLQKPLEDKAFVSDIGSSTLKYKSRPNGLTVQRKVIVEELEIPEERFSDLKSIISLAKNQGLSEIELKVNR